MFTIIIELLYCLSFLAMGSGVLLQIGLPGGLIPRSALLLFGFFGITHGLHEFYELLLLISSRSQSDSSWVPYFAPQLLDFVLLTASYFLLVAFATNLLVKAKIHPRRWSIIPLILFVLWMLSCLLYWQFFPGESFAVRLANLKTLLRYFVAFPSALLSAYAFYSIARAQRDSLTRRGFIYLMGTASALAVYAVFGGLISTPASFFPASVVNTETFEALFGIPVKLVRMLCAITIGGLVALELVVEMGKMRSDWSRMREEFIVVIAHDLRSPLATILMSAQLMEHFKCDNSAGSEQKKAQLIKNVTAGCNALNRMISDLLDASLVETHRIALKSEIIEVIAYLHNLLARMTLQYLVNPIKVRLPEKKIYVDADPQRLEQILSNLMSNAQKYATPGTEISVEAEVQQLELVVSVTNLGEGIRPEEQTMIFSRFQRSKSAQKGRVVGLGLGLYIVKGLVEAHGGRVWVESVPEQYATFRFALPIVRAAF